MTQIERPLLGSQTRYPLRHSRPPIVRASVCDATHVDTLIEERARNLKDNRLVWPLIRPMLYPLLRYRAAIRMADVVHPLSGKEVFDHVAGLLTGLDWVPRAGRPCLIVANHPTGIVDGIALHQSLKGQRDEFAFVAHRDALRVAPRLAEMVIPVEWMIEKRSFGKTRDMWRATRAAFGEGRAVVMFPSGRVAQLASLTLCDRPWHQAAIVIARRNRVPVVPVHIGARNSFIYYLFSRLSPELRSMTLFNELLNKCKHRYRITFGEAILPEALPSEPEVALERLRAHVEEDLPAGRPWQG